MTWNHEQLSEKKVESYSVLIKFHSNMVYFNRVVFSIKLHEMFGLQSNPTNWVYNAKVKLDMSSSSFIRNMFEFKLSESNLCCFCQSAHETLLYLFWECPIKEAFWKRVQQFFVSVSVWYQPHNFLCQCLGLKRRENWAPFYSITVYYLVDVTFTFTFTTS